MIQEEEEKKKKYAENKDKVKVFLGNIYLRNRFFEFNVSKYKYNGSISTIIFHIIRDY